MGPPTTVFILDFLPRVLSSLLDPIYSESLDLEGDLLPSF